MIPKDRNFGSAVGTLGIAVVIGCAELSHGGWTGGMNGTGYGWSGVNVTSSTLVAGSARTPLMVSPSAAMAPTSGYAVNAFLPSGSSVNTYARVKGLPGYVWQAATVGSNGDRTDNQEIEQRVVIKPALCTPSLMMESELEAFDPESGLGSLKVKTVGTAGTALLLRGYEVKNLNQIEEDNPGTPEDESLLSVKKNAELKFETLIVGPFEYGFNGKCELIIHFSLEGKNLEHFILTSDGEAKSSPMIVTCPGPQTVECDQNNFVYPSVEVNTCREVTAHYDPAEEDLQPGLNTVTVTVTDDQGDSATCNFLVNVLQSEFIGFYPPIGAVGGDCQSTAKDVQAGSNIPIKFDFKCGSTLVTSGPKPVVKIERWERQPGNQCARVSEEVALTAEYQNDWHVNWNTTGWTKGIYKIIAELPDGTKPYVFVRLK